MPCTCLAEAGQRCPVERPGAIVACATGTVGLRDLAQCGRKGAGRMPCNRSARSESAAQYLCRLPLKAMPCICPAYALQTQGKCMADVRQLSTFFPIPFITQPATPARADRAQRRPSIRQGYGPRIRPSRQGQNSRSVVSTRSGVSNRKEK